MKFHGTAVLSAAGLLLFAQCSRTGSAVPTQFNSHDLRIEFNVPDHSAEISDRGTMDLSGSLNFFVLKDSAEILSFRIGGEDVELLRYSGPDSGSAVSRRAEVLIPADYQETENDIYLFRGSEGSDLEFELEYRAVFYEDVANASFSNRNIGREISGTILEQGAYLSPASGYYPQGSEKMLNFSLRAVIPEAWESIADGNRESTATAEGVKTQSWTNPYKNDGLMFMAAPYVTRYTKAGSTDVACYFFAEDTSLFDTYLPATAGYIRMYESLIGPYPFERFTVAENFFPTGYGMPAWTLLGQQVIRLPFIVMTSLGHEVLHNWWGNSVYVDYERGNWCEGLTVYGADYRYKNMRSADEAEKYRKDILKDYNSYVNEDNDFPIRKFTARHDNASRTVGYNKTMMVYKMIEDMIGTEAFEASLKTLYREHIEERISFGEIVSVFEKESGMDLGFIIPEWIDRTGAADLDYKVTGTEKNGSGTKVTLEIIQKSPEPYHLRIPLRFTDGSRTIDTSVWVSDGVSTVSMNLPVSGGTVSLDPDYELFRRLYPDEIEPVISGVMGTSEMLFLTGESGEALDAYRKFAENMTEEATDINPQGAVSTSDNALIRLNPDNFCDYLNQNIAVTDQTVTIDGTDYSRSEHTFVLAGFENGGRNMNLTVISEDPASLPRIGDLLEHYGKYSYLVFKGPRNIGKGQWPVYSSSLERELAAATTN